MKFYDLNQLKHGMRAIRVFFVVLAIVLLSGCPGMAEKWREHQLNLMKEAKEAQHRAENFENWRVVFDVTSNIVMSSKYLVEVDWRQTKDKFFIQMKHKNNKDLKELTFYIEGTVDNVWMRGIVTDTNQEVVRLHGEHVNNFFQEQFSYSFPVSHLIYWLRGMPGINLRPDMIALIGVGPSFYVDYIVQNHWSIDYIKYERYNGLSLPQHVKIRSTQIKDLTHDVRIKSWEFTEPETLTKRPDA